MLSGKLLSRRKTSISRLKRTIISRDRCQACAEVAVELSSCTRNRGEQGDDPSTSSSAFPAVF